jgi:predicted O-methyltransferase YrrM
MEKRIEELLTALEARSKSEKDELERVRAQGLAKVFEAAPKLMLDCGRDVAQLLNVMVRALGARRILEIGGSVGYSTIWMAEAARDTGGEVIGLENDRGKHEEQRANLEKAGLAKHTKLICGDASEILKTLDGPFDLVLIDHWKALYIREFDAVWPKMRKGGVVMADNILRPPGTQADMRAYVAHVRNAKGARSYTLDIGAGVEVTIAG